MFAVEKLRLNRFRNVSIPSNHDIFMRVGSRPLPDMADGQVANFASSTMDELDNLEAQYLTENQMPLNENR